MITVGLLRRNKRNIWLRLPRIRKPSPLYTESAHWRGTKKCITCPATNNPSNWLGPIWLVSNYIVCVGLMNCGFHSQACRIATASLRLLSEDLDRTGCLHEYYHPENGAPVMNGGFINWNILALSMAKETGLAGGNLKGENP